MENCPNIFVLDSNENSRKILESYIREINNNSEIKTFENFNQGLEEIRRCAIPPIVFMDISESKDLNKDIESVKLYTPKIVVTSNDYSTDSII